MYLPTDAPWLLEFEREIFAFPLGKHDDMVDAFTMALTEAADYGVSVFGYLGADSGLEFTPTHNEWGRALGNLPR